MMQNSIIIDVLLHWAVMRELFFHDFRLQVKAYDVGDLLFFDQLGPPGIDGKVV